VQVYNDVPKVLLKNSIIAELTAKSYREDRNNEPIFLEHDENGKYWIIVSNQNNIFLVPSINIKLHIHKLKTVAKLFDFHGETASLDTNFMLTKPAKVSSLPNGKEWKLEEKGILEFSDPFLEFKPVLDITDGIKIEEIINQLKHPLVVEFIRNIINEDYQQLNNYVNPENQYDSTSHKTEENTTNENLEDTIIHDNNLENNYQEHGYIDSSIGLTLDEQELVNNYKNPNSDFHEFIIKVSEPEESQTNRWSGSKEATIFKHNRQGNYWIVNKNDSSYIVPQKKFKINEYSQDTLFSTFDCRSYQSGKSENFVLIKPGKVTAINEDGWQLIEPGILQF
jgi:hypothetical protein